MLNRYPSRLIASGIGGVGTSIEFFIAVATLRSGYSFGVFDLVGTALGIFALYFVWRYPLLSALLWCLTLPCLYLGRLLISIACLFVSLFPLLAAFFAYYSWAAENSSLGKY